MYQTITKSDFRDAFHKMERGNQFSYDGLGALYDYLEECEGENGLGIELDVIAICCNFTEYGSLAELQEDYNHIHSLEELENHTLVIPVGEGFIIQNF